MKLLDVLLLPRTLYQRLTDRKATLVLGFAFIGVVDLALNMHTEILRIFSVRGQELPIFNIALFCILAVVIGAIDVVFFSLPLFDLFKLFKRQDGNGAHNLDVSPVKIMKAYVISHFIAFPVGVFTNMVFYGNVTSILLQDFATMLALIMPFWFTAIITRGINSIYNFQRLFKRLAYITVFAWSFILGYVLSYGIDRWITTLFR